MKRGRRRQRPQHLVCAPLLAAALVLAGAAGVAQARTSQPDGYGYETPGCGSSGGGYGGYGGYGGAATGSCATAPPRPRISTDPAHPRAGGDLTLYVYSEGRGIIYTWDLDDDGAYDDQGLTRNEDLSEITHAFAIVGTHRVRVRAIDEDGREGTADLTIQVHAGNRPPRGSINATPAAPHTGRPIAVSAFGYDSDGSIANTAYDLDGNGSFETSPLPGTAVTTSFVTVGQRTLRARFTDDDGATSVATTTVDVHAGNLAPVASVTAYPSAPRVGQSTEIYAYGQDPDGRIARYEFDLDGNDTYETDAGTSRYAYHTFATVGSAEIGVRVTDDEGATSTARGSVQVSDENVVPMVSLYASTTASGLVYQVNASDYDGSIVQVAWDLDGDLVYEDRVRTLSTSFAFDQITVPTPSPGTYEVGVRVTDNGGGVATRRRIVVVRAGALSSPQISNYYGQQPRVGEAVQLSASTQPDATLGWDLDADGAFDDATGTFAQATFATAGSHEIHVRATDARGTTAVGHWVATVSPAAGNLAPRVSLSASPFAPRVATNVLFNAFASDSDGSIASYAWDLDSDGAFDDAASSSFAQRSFPSPGSYLVSVRVTDDDGATAVQRVAVDVHVGNTPPSISLLRNGFFSDETVLVGQIVSMFPSQDAGGDDAIIRWEWDTDEDGAFDDFSDAFQNTHSVSFATPGQHRVRVRAVDAGGAADIATYVVTVVAGANHLPQPSIHGPDGVAPGNDVTFTGYVRDPDGDGVTTVWDLDDDGAFDDATGLTAVTSFPTAGVHTVRLRANDGRGGVATATRSILVRDAHLAPVIETFQTPTEPRPGRSAWLYAHAFDPDGEATTLTFDLDGDGQFDDTPAGGPYSYTWTPSSAASFTIGVRATDVGGQSATKTLEIHPTDTNLAPVASIYQSSGAYIAGHEAWFYASATDLDAASSDTLTYAWDIDGDGFDDGTNNYVQLTLPAGSVTIGLRVTDVEGAATTVHETFHAGTLPPTASFVMSDSTPDEGVAVHFTSTAESADSAIASQRWDLDDDGQFDDASGATATKAFTTTGHVRVGLKVRDADGDNAIVYSTLRVRSLTAPVASFDALPDYPNAGEDVTFTSSSTDPQGAGDIASQQWDLDADGQFDDATGPTATKAFEDPGYRRVKLRVVDAAGHESVAVLYLYIYFAPPVQRPLNDDFAAAAAISAAAPELRGLNATATAQTGEPQHGSGGPSHSVWARYDATTAGSVSFGTCGSEFDTVLAVYTGTSLTSLTRVAGDDDGGSACAAGTSKLTFAAVAGRTYWLAVDGLGAATGRYRLSLHAPPQTPAPPNDALANAMSLGTINDIPGTNVGATKESGEPAHAGDPGGHSVWYVLQGSGAIRADVCSAAFDAVLAVYTKDATGLHAVDGDDPAACDAGAGRSIDFTAATGLDYLVAVDGRGGSTGSFRLRLTRAPANDSFAAATPFSTAATGTTALATAEADEPAHAGLPAARSVWYTITTFSTSKQVLSTCSTSTARTRIAVYEGTTLAALTPVASGSPALGCGEGRGATVSWRPSSSSQHVYRIVVDEAGPGPADFLLESGSAPFNDDLADASFLGSDSSVFSTTRFATHETGEPDHAGAGGTSSVWYALTPGRTTRQRVETCDGFASSDTVLAVYTLAGSELTRVAASDDFAGCPTGRQSRVEFDASAGVRYYVAVDARPSQQGTFSLKTRLRPTNDNRAVATQLSGEALHGTTTGSTLEVATKESGEPDHAGNAGGHSIWYRWTAPAGGSTTIDTCNSSMDTLLGVYTESGGVLTPVASNDDTAGCSPNGRGSSVQFLASGGVEYLFAIDGKNGAEGSVLLRFPPSNDLFGAASVRAGESFTASGDLARASAEPGEPAHRSIATQRSAWFAWTPSRSAQATVDTCGTSAGLPGSPSTTDPSLGTRVAVYTGATMATLTAVSARPRSACATGTVPARLRFDATAGTTYRIAVDSAGIVIDSLGTLAYPAYFLSARLAPVNDDLTNATNLGSSASLSRSGTIGDGGREPGEPDHATAGGTTSVWYRWTAPRSATLRVDTCSSQPLDTAIALYTQLGSGMAGLQAVASNDDAVGCGPAATGSRLRAHVASGTSYWVAVTGHGDVEGRFDLAMVLGPVNDDIANAASLFAGTTFGSTLDAGHEALEPDHQGAGGDHSVWYRLTLANERNVELRACPAGGSPATVLAAYSGTGLALVADGTSSVVTVDGISCQVVKLRRVTGDRLVAIDGAGAAAQGSFSLRVAIAPTNDDRDHAPDVSGAFETFGTTEAATHEEGEPDHAAVAGGRSVWYRWKPSHTGPVTIDTCASTLDTLLAVYTASGATLTPVAASDDDATCSAGASRLRFTAIAATEYLVAVDGKNGAEGWFTLGFPPANDLFADASALSGELRSSSGTLVRAGAEPSEPSHAAAAAARSVWYAWTPPRSGRVQVSTCLASAAATRVAIYSGDALASLATLGSAAASAGCAEGRGALAKARVTGGTTYRIAVDGAAGATFTLQAALAPVNDDRADAIAIGERAIVSGTTAFATTEDGEPSRAGHAADASVWYHVNPTADGPITLKTCSSSFATVLGVYDESLGAFHEVASSDASDGRCANRAGLTFSAVAGKRYLVAIDRAGAAGGAFELAVRPPSNDDIQDAAPLSGEHASGVARTEAATTQDADPADLVQFGRRTAWWSWTATSSGPIELNVCGSSYSPVLAVYHGSPGSLVRDGVSTFASGCGSRARLTLTAVSGRTYLIAVASTSGGTARVQVGPPANDRFATAQPLTGEEDEASGTLGGASAEDGEPSHGDGGARRTIWYSWIAPDDGLLALDSCGSPTPVNIAAYTGSAVSSLSSLPAIDPPGSCPGASPGTSRRFPVESGVGYRIALESTDETFGETLLKLHLNVDSTPPVTTIDDGPPSLTADFEQRFEFSSNEEGSTFECRLDATPFAPCTSPVVRSGLPEGDHVFQVRAADRAGNVDADPPTHVFRVDRTPPRVTIDVAPSEVTQETTARFEFSSDDPTATFTCALDGEEPAVCASTLTRSGLADGEHELTVRATDPAGNAATARAQFTVDTTAPDTVLTVVPGDPTNEPVPSVQFSAESGATFTCAIDSTVYKPCTSPHPLPGLGDGDHVVRVRATDRAGNVELEPAEHPFEVDRTPPETTITERPSGPFHEGQGFGYSSTEDGGFECAIDAEDFRSCGLNEVLDLTGVAPGDHMFHVRAHDIAGNLDATPATEPFTFVDARPVAALAVSPDAGAANLKVQATVSATDADGDPLDYELDFGDGTRTTGALPQSEPITHTYGRAGLFVVRLEVSDGYVSHILTHNVTVVLPEPLKADAGDDLIVVAGEPVKLDGGGSRPLAGIEQHHWTFGDGATGDGAVIDHTYGTPGTYDATLTVQAGTQSDIDTSKIEVLPADAALGVLVHVTSSGAPLQGADVLVVNADGQRVSAVTGPLGAARLRGLPEGSTKILAYAAGHLPGGATATVVGGTGEVTIDLAVGEVAKAELTSRVMTLQEIIDAGIDPNDPDNQHVYQFTVNLQVTDPGGGGGGGGGGGSFGGYLGGGGFIGGGSGGWTCRRLACRGTVSGSTVYVAYHEVAPGVPTLTTLVIPFRARWLKEFFDVSMTINNLAEDPSFVLSNGSAMLELPPGLTLPTTGRGEHLTVPVADIPGGGEATANWIVRGDVEGEYLLNATYGATLEPFGRSVSIRGEMENPFKVWAGSALKLTVEVDDTVGNGHPFHVQVALKNVADVPVYNPAVELLKEGRRGYIEQPRQQREFATAEILPGDTFSAGPFIIVPEATGAIDLGRSFIKKTAGDVDLGGEIVTKVRVPSIGDDPHITTYSRLNAVALAFEPIAGASGYDAFATPDRETDFPADPLPSTRPKATTLKVAATPGTSLHYAISTTHDGVQEMIHPLASAGASSTEIWPKLATSIGPCGDTKQALTVDMEDPVFDLTRWQYKRDDDADWQEGGVLSGSEATRTTDVDIADGTIVVRVRAQNTEQQDGDGSSAHPSWGPAAAVTLGRCNYTAIGDSVSAGEGIGYGYEWDNTIKRWDDETGADEDWDEGDRVSACHQTTAAHPRVLATLTSMRLKKHLSCTGATFDKGIAGPQTDKEFFPLPLPQVGGFKNEGDPANPAYADSKPDVVTLSIGANDIDFAKVVGTCFYPLTWLKRDGTCDGNLDQAEDRMEDGYIAGRFDKIYQRLTDLGTESGRQPIVLHTQYINPFPDADEDQSCFDIKGDPDGGTGFSRDEVNRMVAGLKVLNGLIEQEAEKYDSVISVPVADEFRQHSFCSDHPWVFGMDTAVDWHGTLNPVQASPFHPTADGQAAIARQLQRYVGTAVPIDTGTGVGARFVDGALLRFTKIVRAGTTVLTKVAGAQIPDHPGFDVRQAYNIKTAAEYVGSVAVQLPAEAGDKMWHYVDGAWQDVQATFDGAMLHGNVTSLSPFAVGPAATPVTARVTGGIGGVVPKDVALSAADSSGPVDSVAWDFGDGTEGTGTTTTHRYIYSGTYDIVATVHGTDGGVDRATTTVTITNPGPAFVAVVPGTAEAGDAVSLDSRASTDSNGTVAGGWWERDGEILEPPGQLSHVTFDKVGAVTVEGVVRDDELKEARKAFSIMVVDTTGPVIADVSADITVEAADAAGATATYASPTASDVVDGSVPVACVPASGSIFGLGKATVTCSARDAAHNGSTATFKVDVVDTTPPTLTVPDDKTVEATGPSGATVSYTVSAVDSAGPVEPVSCSKASGGVFALGATTVTCTATDSHHNTSAAKSFTVTVRDSTGPVLAGVPDDETVEATSAAGARVTFTSPTATDAVDGVRPVSCAPASGATFAIGTTIVRCSSEDTTAHGSQATFKVEVVDTTAPVLTVPDDKTVEATGPSGATVAYTVSAVDSAGPVGPVTCSKASGAVFPLAATTVTCTATDSQANSATKSFKVTVRDTRPPTIAGVPADKSVEASSPAGASVTFASPTASDVVDGARPVSCVPASGSTFPITITTVTCSTEDAAGNDSQATFKVAVVDTTRPALTVPADKVVEATGPAGATVNYDVSATDSAGSVHPIDCSRDSGSVFPLGATVVTCTVTDAHGNATTKAFKITVVDTADPAITGVPADRTIEATAPSGAIVTYTSPTASDVVGGARPVTCIPPSGATFALGTTSVACSASDSAGNHAEASFKVTVKDTTGPALAGIPADATIEASTATGAVVTYASPTATDVVDGARPVACTPLSGATFAIGSTTVSCSSADVAHNASRATFKIVVLDTVGPVLAGVPADATVQATDASGAVVVFTPPTATDAVDGPRPVVCAPTSGAVFPVGTTTVTCSANDSRAHTSSVSFTIAVTALAESPPPPVAPPAAPPPPAVSPLVPPPPVVAPRVEAKLRLTRARIEGKKLIVRARITAKATGKLKVAYTAGATTIRFSVVIKRGAIRFERKLKVKQRRKKTGTLELSYPGNVLVLPGRLKVRVLAAKRGS